MQGRFLDEVFDDVYKVLKYMNAAMAGFAFVALALARPVAIEIHACAQVVLCPLVHQRVARAGVETGHLLRRVGRQNGDIGNAADIKNDPVLTTPGKHRLVEGRDQRGPLAAVTLSSDPSVVTALANDYGFDRVFARQVEAQQAAAAGGDPEDPSPAST